MKKDSIGHATLKHPNLMRKNVYETVTFISDILAKTNQIRDLEEGRAIGVATDDRIRWYVIRSGSSVLLEARFVSNNTSVFSQKTGVHKVDTSHLAALDSSLSVLHHFVKHQFIDLREKVVQFERSRTV